MMKACKMKIDFIRIPVILLCVCFSSSAHSEEPAAGRTPVGPVTVSPVAVRVIHQRQGQSLLVSGRTADGISLDLTTTATFQVADPTIAVVENGYLRPLKSGETKVTITAAGQTLEVPVKVELPAVEPPYSFRHEVMPVLSKAGCNMGACHGYSLGKGGFKLSLRGANATHDHEAIFNDAFGRRVSRLDPSKSLLIQKPVGDVPHRGGTRFPRNGLLHQILLKWVDQGAKGDLDNKAEVDHVSIAPDRFVVEPGMRQQLQVTAHYTDGTTRDVTRLSIFTVNTDGVAEVDENGLVTSRDFGESAVVARFERKFAASQLIVLKRNPSFQPTPVPTDHFIDQHVVTKLNDLKVHPSDLATDEEFLRRVYLDLIGIQPTPDELRAFLVDTNPAKRTVLIDTLFTRPQFVDHWSLKWGDLFQNSRTRSNEPAVYAFREWVRSAVAANMPLDEFTRQLLTSRGGTADNPASTFFAISKDTNETLERVAQIFCGVRMLCARCHPHPMENWTQEDYYGLNSFFNQVTTKADPRLVGVQNPRSVVLQMATAFATNPRTSSLQPPRYLGGGEPPVVADSDRRVDFARWLTTRENPHFARSIVNRFWSYFFHRGIIDPVDDLRTTNPPINPALLEALTKDFVDHGFDVRHLMRSIVTSRTYQRSSLSNATNQHDTLNFSHTIPRRIPAEALLDSLVQATGVRENFGGAPAGFSAAQLPDADVTSDFLSLFGKPQRMEACECERDNESNMLQALHLINGNSILRRVTDPNGRVALLLNQKLPDDALIEELYLWALVRRPSPKEIEVAKQHFQAYGADRTGAAQDLMWAILNSRDFVLNQ